MARGAATGPVGARPGAASPPADEVPGDDGARRRPTTPRSWPAPPRWRPSGLLNRLSVPRLQRGLVPQGTRSDRRDELQSIPTFFHPLDMVDRLEPHLRAAAGFLQWQYVVPFGAEDVVRHTVAPPAAPAAPPSFVAVLKRFGAGQPRPAVVPDARLDPGGRHPGRRAPVSARCSTSSTTQVVAAGGRVYLAKDSRVRPELLPAMYPRLDEWRAVRAAGRPRRQPAQRPRPTPDRSGLGARPAADPTIQAQHASIWGSSSSRGRRRCGSRSRPGPAVPRGRPGGRCGPGRRPRRSPAAPPGARPRSPGRRRPRPAPPCRRDPTRPAAARRAPPRGRSPASSPEPLGRSRPPRPGARWR